jgi:hypothetical protein
MAKAVCGLSLDGAELCCYRFIRTWLSGYFASGSHGNFISLRKPDLDYKDL